MGSKKMFSSLRWIFFVSRRFSQVERKTHSSITSMLSSLGVCFGVMALIVIMSVMNGFQMSFIDAIMQISSYHVRVSQMPDLEQQEFIDWCNSRKDILNVTPFYEAQGLMVGASTSQSAALIRCVPSWVYEQDQGFSRELNVISGKFDLSSPENIVLGSTLARSLGVHVGSRVTILALSGSSDVSLISDDRQFTVTGIFSSGYADLNSSYSFISLEAGDMYLGSNPQKIFGIKLKNSSSDEAFIRQVQSAFPEVCAESWRVYNRSFFGALRIEKNMLMLLVLLIFVVVAVNIYNGMRRMVFERSEEIAVLCALGGKPSDVQKVFVLRGFLTGLKGAVPGLLAGIFLSINMETVFMLLSKLQYYVQYFILSLVNPSSVEFLVENSMYRIYANIPARMIPSELILIFLFGIFSSLVASYLAGRKIMKLTIVEVLRNE